MRYYLDTEFDETETGVSLISLALVAEDGRELYLVSGDLVPLQCNLWVRENVLPHLSHGLLPDGSLSPSDMPKHIERFMADDPGPWKFWGYYCAYDWYLFCRLWGGMLRMPPRFPKLCLDVKQVAEAMYPGLSLKKQVPPEMPEHNALADARWTARLHAWLTAQGTP